MTGRICSVSPDRPQATAPATNHESPGEEDVAYAARVSGANYGKMPTVHIRKPDTSSGWMCPVEERVTRPLCTSLEWKPDDDNNQSTRETARIGFSLIYRPRAHWHLHADLR